MDTERDDLLKMVDSLTWENNYLKEKNRLLADAYYAEIQYVKGNIKVMRSELSELRKKPFNRVVGKIRRMIRPKPSGSSARA